MHKFTPVSATEQGVVLQCPKAAVRYWGILLLVAVVLVVFFNFGRIAELAEGGGQLTKYDLYSLSFFVMFGYTGILFLLSPKVPWLMTGNYQYHFDNVNGRLTVSLLGLEQKPSVHIPYAQLHALAVRKFLIGGMGKSNDKPVYNHAVFLLFKDGSLWDLNIFAGKQGEKAARQLLHTLTTHVQLDRHKPAPEKYSPPLPANVQVTRHADSALVHWRNWGMAQLLITAPILLCGLIFLTTIFREQLIASMGGLFTAWELMGAMVLGCVLLLLVGRYTLMRRAFGHYGIHITQGQLQYVQLREKAPDGSAGKQQVLRSIPLNQLVGAQLHYHGGDRSQNMELIIEGTEQLIFRHINDHDDTVLHQLLAAQPALQPQADKVKAQSLGAVLKASLKTPITLKPTGAELMMLIAVRHHVQQEIHRLQTEQTQGSETAP